MKLLCGDELGQLKLIEIKRGIDASNPSSEAPTIQRFGKLDKQKGILFFCQNENFVYVLRKSAAIECWDIKKEPPALDSLWQLDEKLLDNASIISFQYAHGWLMIAFSNGTIVFRNPELGQVKKIQVASPLSCATLHPRIAGVVAIGGEENDVSIYSCNASCSSSIDLSTLWNQDQVVRVFQAKNVKNDALDLRVRVWVTGIVFTEEVLNVIDGKDEDDSPPAFHFATITHYGQLRFYYTKQARRPIFSTDISTSELTRIGLLPSINMLYFADKRAQVYVFDPIKKKVVGRFQGIKGSASCLHNLGDLIAIVGLDRHLRIYDVHRKPVANAYVKVMPTSILLLDGRDEEVIKEEEESRVAKEEEEEIWRNMEQLNDKEEKKDERKTKKQKRS
ncbi:ribosome biogenesis protein N [Schizosaccharomyces cryophilus OY26]|uniref:Ribosome biogenesis protein NSA1 n=1 Tax=Schizosaccharomyces cryophilus (strain OY26 / ATCC MYA-4695 / CBS 11777 / NBRC 106824 / NRRL Y48691) TaxID=653667 RepID=S9VML2_SCHCR|nr:ribosome biogenesis protein N [Schizosaccharomyces cryophilus OY26]EPY49193.1 ribosome biogenesis protein N [Schizosaccharomyces cryophilus OY26]